MIETERLLLRRPTEADVESPPAWLSDPEVMDWLGGVEPAAEVVRQWLDQWERFPTGKFLVELKSDGALVGRVGANYYDVQTWQRSPVGEPELGWALAREQWGHGYATEAARALRDWALGERGLNRLISLIQHGNVRSVRVAEKLGERYERDVEVRGKATRLYLLER